jgi:hypothetical protein
MNAGRIDVTVASPARQRFTLVSCSLLTRLAPILIHPLTRTIIWSLIPEYTDFLRLHPKSQFESAVALTCNPPAKSTLQRAACEQCINRRITRPARQSDIAGNAHLPLVTLAGISDTVKLHDELMPDIQPQ